MSVEVSIVDGPVGPAPEGRAQAATGGAAGAVVVFDGVVRPLEGGREIIALDYQVYQPMAGRVLRELGESILARRGLLHVAVWHSRGRVPVGQTSFRLLIESLHRREALGAMGEFIDALKRDAPIWKHPVFTDAGSAIVPRSERASATSSPDR